MAALGSALHKPPAGETWRAFCFGAHGLPLDGAFLPRLIWFSISHEMMPPLGSRGPLNARSFCSNAAGSPDHVPSLLRVMETPSISIEPAIGDGGPVSLLSVLHPGGVHDVQSSRTKTRRSCFIPSSQNRGVLLWGARLPPLASQGCCGVPYGRNCGH